MRKLIVLTLSVTAGAALAQTSPPTGIVKSGSVALIRADGKISLGPTPPVEFTTEMAIGGFQVADYTNYTPPPQQPFTTIGACVVTTFTPQTTPPSGAAITSLDAGPVLNLTGPNGPMQIPNLPNTKGVYSAMVGGGAPLPMLPAGISIPGVSGPKPLYLDPGTYTVDNGGGGADVGPFTATLNVPAALVWTNADSDLTIDRTAGVDIQWTGGDPAGVYIQGSVTITDPTSHQLTGGGAFSCLAPNTGEFKVTSDVTSLLPATPAGGGLASPTSLLAVGSLSQANFSASGIDTGLFSYTSGYSRSVVYQ